jgi:hypothetical protein
MAPRTDRTTRIPSGVASSVTTKHAAKGSVFVNLRNAGNSKIETQMQMDMRGNLDDHLLDTLLHDLEVNSNPIQFEFKPCSIRIQTLFNFNSNPIQFQFKPYH